MVPKDGTGRDPQVRQEIKAKRDAYAAGANQVVIHFSADEAAKPTVPLQVWGEVPVRNLGFTGRDNLLGELRRALASGDRAVVQALRGMGGVGKTQLAIEYTHRYATDYDIVWWIAAEQPQLIGPQFAALGVALGCTQPGTDDSTARRMVLGELHGRERWLLIFDNAEHPEHIIGWLPGGHGHVLITSRSHGWDEVAVPVEVDVLDRAESVALLRRRVAGLGKADAGRVAQAVGDLPLAVAQAAGYMSQSGTLAAEYVRLIETRAAELLKYGRPASYPLSLAAVTQLALDRLATVEPAAAQALRICAFLAPDPIPAAWFILAADHLPVPLRQVAMDPLAWGRALTRSSGQALVRINQQDLLMHRLTQAIIRTSLTSDEAAAAQAQVTALLAAVLLEMDYGDIDYVLTFMFLGSYSQARVGKERRKAMFQLLAHWWAKMCDPPTRLQLAHTAAHLRTLSAQP